MIIADSQAGQTALGLFIWLIVAVLYFVPTIVALFRQGKVNVGGIVVLNLFAFLFFPWIIALVMACRTPVPQQVYYAPPPGWQPPPPPPGPQG